jgi:ATP-dependent 26S proteasome regulatory subunit
MDMLTNEFAASPALTVATNEPTILDPATLRKPGCFDRVVCFPNPSAVLRHEYFCRMHEQFLAADLDSVVCESEAFPLLSSARPTSCRGSSRLKAIVRIA